VTLRACAALANGNDDVTGLPTRSNLTLGILAGGRATRLGGLDKAWLLRDGRPQVLRWRERFDHEVGSVLVSANRDLARYQAAGLATVVDAVAGLGPLAGLAALADACRTPWLLTVPVDLVGVNECLLPTLVAMRAADGALACDDDGEQPLVALWRVAALGPAVAAALAGDDAAVHALQRRLDVAVVRFAGVRFGNLNTASDLVAAGLPADSIAP
jgi:molybdopterin-guanine dinucleotide biosynthesis protein A